MNPGACILDAFGQLWEIPCFKGLRGGWFPRKRDKDFILKLLVRWETRINSAQKLNRRNSTNHQNRYAPIIFNRSTSGSITTGRSHFLHCTIWVNSSLNSTTKSRKARPSDCYKKLPCPISNMNWYSRIFLASRAAKCDVPISEGISQADLNPLSPWLLTQPWIAYSAELPIAPAFGAWCLAE